LTASTDFGNIWTEKLETITIFSYFILVADIFDNDMMQIIEATV